MQPVKTVRKEMRTRRKALQEHNDHAKKLNNVRDNRDDVIISNENVRMTWWNRKECLIIADGALKENRGAMSWLMIEN